MQRRFFAADRWNRKFGARKFIEDNALDVRNLDV
jgi:hypothetical protein